jgi:ornithine carbamoyltransferase
MHTHTSASSPATPSSRSDADAILAGARELAHAAEAGSIPPVLRGMYLGLVCGAEDTEASRLFERAATALGARVTSLVLNASDLDAAGEDRLRKTARMLGRLYDGLECQGLAPALIQQLRRTAGVPVFHGLATPGHATAALADRLTGPTSMGTKRLLVLQGALIVALLNQYPASTSASPGETS